MRTRGVPPTRSASPFTTPGRSGPEKRVVRWWVTRAAMVAPVAAPTAAAQPSRICAARAGQ